MHYKHGRVVSGVSLGNFGWKKKAIMKNPDGTHWSEKQCYGDNLYEWHRWRTGNKTSRRTPNDFVEQRGATDTDHPKRECHLNIQDRRLFKSP